MCVNVWRTVENKEYAFPDGFKILQTSEITNSDIRDGIILAEADRVVGLVEDRSKCISNQQLKSPLKINMFDDISGIVEKMTKKNHHCPNWEHKY